VRAKLTSNSPTLHGAAWKQVAEEIGAVYTPGDAWTTERVVARLGQWQTTLSLQDASEEAGSTTYTCLTAFYTSQDEFRFALCRFEILHYLSLPIGLAPASSDDLAFNDAFYIRGSNDEKLRVLVRNDALREYLLAEPQIVLMANLVPNLSTLTPFLELKCMVPSAISEPSRILRLFELIAETLQHLTSTDSPGL
jgi:hypothetical protein